MAISLSREKDSRQMAVGSKSRTPEGLRTREKAVFVLVFGIRGWGVSGKAGSTELRGLRAEKR